MVGTGRTVFSGTEPEPFTARLIGVLRNAAGPRRHIILARLEGGPLASTGVIAGMSGSPVYVNGRLVGAVAYALGTFSKEPIAGITPIAEMHDATTELAATTSGMPVSALWPPPVEDLAASLAGLVGRARAFVDSPDGAEVVTAPESQGPTWRSAAADLRPIATPLALSGFEPDVRARLARMLEGSGLTTVVGSSGPAQASAATAARPLAAGDAVGVELVSGDLSVGATGTVTEVDGDRVYAFGHPFFSLGPVSLPMTRAFVHALLPSLYVSTKIASTGEVIGEVTQDRATAIAGRLGAGPATLPVRIDLTRGGGAPRRFEFRVARDRAFTPLMLYVAMLNVMASFERQAGALSLDVDASIAIAGRPPLTVSGLSSGDAPSLGATALVAGPVALLESNPYERVKIDRIDVKVTASERLRAWSLDRAWLDNPRPRSGETVHLKVALRPHQGDVVVHTVPVAIPAYARGRMSVVVSCGADLAQAEQRETRWPAESGDLGQLITVLGRTPRNNVFYVRLVAEDPGAVVAGRRLPALPPAALAVYRANREDGGTIALSDATIGQWTILTDGVASGARTITVDLAPVR